jgi:RNA polymerase sigma-70 factor (ECF subfamily)
MVHSDTATEELLERARVGDGRAGQELLAQYRQRLRQMVAVRLDRRLAARVDPSDVVQEALADAARKLPDYLRERPMPFYPWLRRLAWERVLKLHQRHIAAGKRSVTREVPCPLPDESALQLACMLFAPGASPSALAARRELHGRVQAAMADLGERDREVLVLRYLEQLSTSEIAEVLGISTGAVKVRHLRALERLRGVLADDFSEGPP